MEKLVRAFSCMNKHFILLLWHIQIKRNHNNANTLIGSWMVGYDIILLFFTALNCMKRTFKKVLEEEKYIKKNLLFFKTLGMQNKTRDIYQESK